MFINYKSVKSNLCLNCVEHSYNLVSHIIRDNSKLLAEKINTWGTVNNISLDVGHTLNVIST